MAGRGFYMVRLVWCQWMGRALRWEQEQNVLVEMWAV